METIFKNTKNRKTNGLYKFVLNLPQILDLKSSNRYVAFQNLSIYYTRKTYKTIAQKQLTQNNSSNVEWQVWIAWRFLFSVRYSRLYWVHRKNHKKSTTNPVINIYNNSINNRLVFKTKNAYSLELQTHETMNFFFGSPKKSKDKTKNGERSSFGSMRSSW